MNPTPSISVLIVNFNSGPWLDRCVESVLATHDAAEILVGDNGSSDDSVTRLETRLQASADDPQNCRVLRFGQNLGFATAVNRLLEVARGEYFLLLNPDCIVPAGTIPAVARCLRNDPEAGMAGCLIRNPDGSEQRGCRRRIPTIQSAFFRSVPWAMAIARRFRQGTRDLGFDLTDTPLPDTPTPIEAISGAFMMISRTALDRVGPMDPLYFLHCEDLDWCLRFAQAGYRILFVPGAEIIHKQGSCSTARPIRVEWHKHVGMIRFYRKFYGNQQPVLTTLVTIAVALRFVLSALRAALSKARR